MPRPALFGGSSVLSTNIVPHSCHQSHDWRACDSAISSLLGQCDRAGGGATPKRKRAPTTGLGVIVSALCKASRPSLGKGLAGCRHEEGDGNVNHMQEF